MRTIMLAATALTPLAATAALAADIEARSRINAVTVYPDAALVTRVMEIDLPAGASNIVRRGLRYALDPASLRVAGEGSAAIGIGAVEARLAPADTKPDTAIEARLKFPRRDDGCNGLMATRLWERHQAGDGAALKRLLSYNVEDLRGMQHIKRHLSRKGVPL